MSDVEATPLYGAGGALIGESTTTGVNGQVVATSDGNGRFEVRSIHCSSSLAAYAPGHAMSRRYQLSGARGRHCPLTIRLDRAGTVVTGLVVDRGGKPVAHAVVSLDLEQEAPREYEDGVLRHSPAPRRERSGADGRFELEGAPLAPARLIVAAVGFAPTCRTITPSASGVNDLVITLEEGGTLAGSVRDETGAPVGGVDLDVVPDDYALAQNFDPIRARSDAGGGFEVEHLASVPLRASTDASRGRATTTFTVQSGATHLWNAVVSRGRLLRGRVVDERDAPLVQWTVAARAADGRSRPPLLDVKSDAEGRFEFSECADVDYEVSARHPEATSFSLGVDATARPGGAEVVLRVRDAELPTCWISGSLRVPDGYATTDAMLDVAQIGGPGSRCTMVGLKPGRFDSGPFPAGRYAISLRISRLPTRDLGIRELKPGDGLDLGEIVFDRPAHVVVHARHADGTAVDAKELCVLSRDSPARVELTRERSNLESPPLDPGSYLLCCDPSSASSVWQPFDVAAGEQLELTTTLEPAALRVFRFAPAARAPDRVTVRCFDESGAERWSQNVAPDARGALELRARFTVGKWTLEATASDASRAEFDVPVESLKDEEAAREIALR